MLSIALIIRFSTNYKTSCAIFANNSIKGDITKEINIILGDLNTNELSIKKISYKENRDVSVIDINSNAINGICNKISSDIYDLLQSKRFQYGIPIGNVLGTPYFSSKGYKIKFEVVSVGYVNYNINSELISGGVNQTVHRISAIFSVKIQCIAPFQKIEIEMSLPLILSETLISGNIPLIMLSS